MSRGDASISQIERRVRGADDGPELASSQSCLCRVRRCKLLPFPHHWLGICLFGVVGLYLVTVNNTAEDNRFS